MRMWKLGVLVPLVATIVLLADIASRTVLPLEKLAFRAWEAVSRKRQWPAPFEANRHYRNDRTYGELAAMGNLPERRIYRPEVFTTDRLGCRNPDWFFDGSPVDAIFLGSSFIAGAGLNDDETIPIQLGQLSGRRIYNAGGSVAPPPELFQKVAKRLGFERGLVFREIVIRDDTVRLIAGQRQPAAQAPRATFGLPDMEEWARGSSLRVLLRRGLRSLENDRILPNASAGAIAQGRLRNGEPMLFLRAEVAPPSPAPGLVSDPITDWLTAHGYRVVVVLMPGKYLTYVPHLADRPSGQQPAEQLREQLRHTLSAAGYSVVDLTSVLREAATRLLPESRYVYWQDDTHLTPEGARVVAEALAEWSAGHWEGLAKDE